jgi:hypothetical protein
MKHNILSEQQSSKALNLKLVFKDRSGTGWRQIFRLSFVYTVESILIFLNFFCFVPVVKELIKKKVGYCTAQTRHYYGDEEDILQ